MKTILVVEDKESMLRMLSEALETEGYNVIPAHDGKEGIEKLKQEKIDMVITDLKLPGKDGLDVLKESKKITPLSPVIVMTAYGSIETAVEAMKMGAYDFLTKPVDIDHLLLLIDRAFENQRMVTENMLLKEVLTDRVGIPEIIGKSQKMIELAETIKKVASTKTTVLLLGESGTGKELFARAIHDLSPRRDYPFVPINCAAIPRDLLESELFGFEKGAFTGAHERKIGKLELAHHGTVFLDEIGEMDVSLQSKLLRVLQEGEIQRIGGTSPVKVDIRIIAASNKDLERAVNEGKFREDLYFRINVFPVIIPPLRERREDIPALVEHFIAKFSAEMNIPPKKVSAGAMDRLMNYHWKGNVRELENVIERAMIISDSDTIEEEDLRLGRISSESLYTDDHALEGSLEDVARRAMRIAETKKIKEVLEETGGNKTKAAEILGVSYKTLLTKIKEYGI